MASPWGAAGHDGLVPVRGNLMPEVAAQLQLGFDSVLNPRVDEVPGPCFVESEPTDRDEPIESAADERTHAQKQHDALAVLLDGCRGIRVSADPGWRGSHSRRVGA